MRGIVQRLDQRHGRAQESATGAEMRSSLERHKRAGDRMLCGAGQLRIGPAARSLTHPRDNHLTGGTQDLLTLVLGQLRTTLRNLIGRTIDVLGTWSSCESPGLVDRSDGGAGSDVRTGKC